jgi:hypothetical protein
LRRRYLVGTDGEGYKQRSCPKLFEQRS